MIKGQKGEQKDSFDLKEHLESSELSPSKTSSAQTEKPVMPVRKTQEKEGKKANAR